MLIDQLLKAAKNNKWTSVNYIIENSGLELTLIQDLRFCKMWKVENHTQINLITNTMKCVGQNVSELTFCCN